MRKITIYFLSLLACSGGLFLPLVHAQQTTRMGFSPITARTSDVTETLPCAGSILFSEDFEAGIPGTWTIIDGDGKVPRPEMGLVAGWQGITDYRDSTDHAAATPSWYVDAGQSNDWLITPAITVGANSCLSWNAYSQDAFFKEGYEVRIATSNDTAAFLANPAVFASTALSGTPAFYSVSLSAYAGQTVFVAFRQTSDDKFVLVLDDVRVANVNTLDIGFLAISQSTANPGDTVSLSFEVANYGSDTITSFLAIYQVGALPAQSMNVNAVSLPPNHTAILLHDSLYISDSVNANVPICAWTNLPNSTFDQDQSNDTTCSTLKIGNPVGRPDPSNFDGSVLIYPNPFEEFLTIQFENLGQQKAATVRIFDMRGRIVFAEEASLRDQKISLDLPQMPAGMYILELSNGKESLRRKLMRN